MPVNGRVTPLAFRLESFGASAGRGLSLVLIFAWTPQVLCRDLGNQTLSWRATSGDRNAAFSMPRFVDPSRHRFTHARKVMSFLKISPENICPLEYLPSIVHTRLWPDLVSQRCQRSRPLAYKRTHQPSSPFRWVMPLSFSRFSPRWRSSLSSRGLVVSLLAVAPLASRRDAVLAAGLAGTAGRVGSRKIVAHSGRRRM